MFYSRSEVIFGQRTKVRAGYLATWGQGQDEMRVLYHSLYRSCPDWQLNLTSTSAMGQSFPLSLWAGGKPVWRHFISWCSLPSLAHDSFFHNYNGMASWAVYDQSRRRFPQSLMYTRFAVRTASPFWKQLGSLGGTELAAWCTDLSSNSLLPTPSSNHPYKMNGWVSIMVEPALAAD